MGFFISNDFFFFFFLLEGRVLLAGSLLQDFLKRPLFFKEWRI
jgi:hypothetical protein